MPFDVLGRTRATLTSPTSISFIFSRVSNGLEQSSLSFLASAGAEVAWEKSPGPKGLGKLARLCRDGASSL